MKVKTHIYNIQTNIINIFQYNFNGFYVPIIYYNI